MFNEHFTQQWFIHSQRKKVDGSTCWGTTVGIDYLIGPVWFGPWGARSGTSGTKMDLFTFHFRPDTQKPYCFLSTLKFDALEMEVEVKSGLLKVFVWRLNNSITVQPFPQM